MNLSDLTNTEQSWFDIPPVQAAGGRNAARKLQNSSNQMAFFKTPALHVQGNEVLGYVMANKLNLPCAEVKFATLPDPTGQPTDGILSFKITGVELMEWPLVADKIRNSPMEYIMNYEDIGRIAAFDIWTHNNDRSTANLIISNKVEWKEKYIIYMIDHEECFYGYPETCNRTEDNPAWSILTNFVSIPEIKEAIKFSKIEPFISKIEAIDDSELKALVDLF